MKRQHSLFLMILSLLLLGAFVTSLWAQDMGALKVQMQNRKPTIDALKGQGVIGEGFDGYLHVRKAQGNAQQVVNAENADRRAVNTIIAKNEGAPVDVVSKKLAAKLYSVAPAGHWFKKQDGSWQQKK